MIINNISVDQIYPYENNPRVNDAAVDAVAKSIKQFGFQQPIVVDADHVIIVGHTRYKAALKLGYKEVPVVVASELTESQAQAYRVIDNKSAEIANWDNEKLEMEYARLVQSGEVDMDGFGFDDIDVDAVIQRIDGTERTQSLNDCEELEIDDYDDEKFRFTCPHCGLKFNEGK